MKFIFRNLKSLFCNEPLVSALMILCIFVSSLILNFSYGLYQNYYTELVNEGIKASEMRISIKEPKMVTKKDLRNCVLTVPNEINRNIAMYFITASVVPFNFGQMSIRFSVDNSKIVPCELFANNIRTQGQLIGEYFSFDQEISGDNVAIIPTDKNYLQYTHTEEKDGQFYIEVQNRMFRVIGKIDNQLVPFVPFEALDNDTAFQGTIIIRLRDNKYFSKNDYSSISRHFNDFFGDSISIPGMMLPDEGGAKFYRTILLITYIISILSAINLVMLYHYIIQTRSKKYAIFRMHGCGRLNLLIISVGECVVLIIPCYLLALYTYINCFIPFLEHTYPNMTTHNSSKVYLVIFICYFMISIIVILIMMVRHLMNSRIIQDMRR